MADEHHRDAGVLALDLGERPPDVADGVQVGGVPAADAVAEHPHLQAVATARGVQGAAERHHAEDGELVAVHPAVAA